MKCMLILQHRCRERTRPWHCLQSACKYCSFLARFTNSHYKCFNSCEITSPAFPNRPVSSHFQGVCEHFFVCTAPRMSERSLKGIGQQAVRVSSNLSCQFPNSKVHRSREDAVLHVLHWFWSPGACRATQLHFSREHVTHRRVLWVMLLSGLFLTHLTSENQKGQWISHNEVMSVIRLGLIALISCINIQVTESVLGWLALHWDSVKEEMLFFCSLQLWEIGTSGYFCACWHGVDIARHCSESRSALFARGCCLFS